MKADWLGNLRYGSRARKSFSKSLIRPAFSEPGEFVENRLERRKPRAKKRLGTEQIVMQLRQVDVLQSGGKSVTAACKEVGPS